MLLRRNASCSLRRQEPRSPPRLGDRKCWLLLLLPQAMYSSKSHRVHRWRLLVETIIAALGRKPQDLELTKLRKCKEPKTQNARSAGDHQSPKGGENSRKQKRATGLGSMEAFNPLLLARFSLVCMPLA